jgi:hypothetical protein
MHNKLTALAWCFCIGLMLSGCGSSSHSAYVPSEEAGKHALEAALAAWQDGKRMERIENAGSAAIETQDADWKSGKKLASYSIQKELPTTEGPKQFSVRLTFQGDASPVDTVYFVVGRDPLWVFRDRDYKRATGQ